LEFISGPQVLSRLLAPSAPAPSAPYPCFEIASVRPCLFVPSPTSVFSCRLDTISGSPMGPSLGAICSLNGRVTWGTGAGQKPWAARF
jgi:hypothetical protein